MEDGCAYPHVHRHVRACIDAYKRQSEGASTGRGQGPSEHTDEMKTIRKEGRRAKNNHGNTCELMKLQPDDIEVQEKEKTNEM